MGTTHVDTLASDRLVAGGATPTIPIGKETIPVLIWGSGPATVVAPKGSLYLRSDGVPQVATDAVGTWADLGAAAPQNLGVGASPTFVGLTLSGVLTGLTNLIMTGNISGAVNVALTGFEEFTEIADPAAGAVETGRLYVRDNGGDKSQLVVRFPTGAIQVIATEP